VSGDASHHANGGLPLAAVSSRPSDRNMDAQDLGDLVAYTALADGTPIYDHQGRRIGVVEHVMEVEGIFEGVIVHTHPLPGRHLYADADQVAEIHERGVVLSVTEQELHTPQQESRRGRAGQIPLEARLRRAWDWLTGQRVDR
jgi:hypothetical protein